VNEPEAGGDDADHGSTSTGPRGLSAVLESSRFLVAIGSLTSLLLGAACFVWALVKGVAFVRLLLRGGRGEDLALVKLFESIDVILIGTVLLMIGLGLWELFIGDLDLPPSLTTDSFDDLKAKIATTLMLVLVVRFLELIVSRPAADELLQFGAAVTLVGGLLLVFARWRR
jgi:uncharacterized membrane protein YqhA